MSNCEQKKGQSVLEHGRAVKEKLFEAISYLRGETSLHRNWKIPNWLEENKDLFLENLPSDETLDLYTVYHDCGKPYCLEIDTEGKRHFPNHSEVSYHTFIQHFDDRVAAELIRRDMDIHLLKSDGVPRFSQHPYALTLLLTGLAEIHANAQMFGGTESTSFKIKWKSLNQRGKQIIKIKTNHENKTAKNERSRRVFDQDNKSHLYGSEF